MPLAFNTRRLLGMALAPALMLGAAAEEISYEHDILPIVAEYCFGCHNAERANADLNLERFETQEMAASSLAIWQRSGRRIEHNEMPPRNRPQPSDEEKELLMAWIRALEPPALDCTMIASEESVNWFPGFVMSRRLNRHEYENTLRDLLGEPVSIAHMFPADGAGGEGFDNHGNALFLSAIQMEKYLEAADAVIERTLPGDGGRSEAWKRLAPDPAEGMDTREAAAGVITAFAQRAWRRPIEDEERERMLALYDRAIERGDLHGEAIKLVFKAVIVSPHFLFLAEPQPREQGDYQLGDYPLASRLSYFLWSSMPDDELFALAEAGSLANDEEIERQVRRMLLDPKAQALGEFFVSQWLGITPLGGTIKPDPNRFPEFDDALAASMHREPALFFTHIVQEDRSLLELLDSDYSFVDERLAALYGLDGVTGEEMRLVHFEDDARGGVLGMAAILTTTSHPLRTSPVLRGKFVLEQLLGDRVPPPPPDAGTLPEDDEHHDGLSLREALELHRQKPECAACHERMDPLGFGLENFDPIGRWRVEQAGLPIDTAGELPTGESFSGPAELKELLLARTDAFTRNFTRKMLGYALGRSLTRYDDCVIDDALAAMEENGWRPSELFTGIALSYPFRHRYSGGESKEESS
jgi:hypothetical protein